MFQPLPDSGRHVATTVTASTYYHTTLICPNRRRAFAMKGSLPPPATVTVADHLTGTRSRPTTVRTSYATRSGRVQRKRIDLNHVRGSVGLPRIPVVGARKQRVIRLCDIRARLIEKKTRTSYSLQVYGSALRSSKCDNTCRTRCTNGLSRVSYAHGRHQ